MEQLGVCLLKIRDATPEDAPFLVKTEKTIAATPGFLVSLPHELSELAFRHKIENLSRISNGKYIVAENNEQIIGHALLEPMGLEAVQHIVRLTIAIHSGHQEKGLGELLMNHLIQWAQSEPTVEKIELNVRASNLRAIRLYQKLGFHFESRIRNRVKLPNGNYVDDYQMGLFLKITPFCLPTVSLSIGKVISSRKAAIDDNWDEVKSGVELDSTQFSQEVFAGIEKFSHVEVIFFMNQVDIRKIETTARHPRNNRNWPKVGIFAQRGKNRPNQIGTTICRILKVEGMTLWLEGLDAIDGTPVLDIKPWVQEFGPRGEVKQPAWMSELMKGYWVE